MSVHDEYAKAVLAGLLGDDVDALVWPGMNEPDLRYVQPRDVVESVYVAHKVAGMAVKESCESHGHDPVPVIDLFAKEAWYRCARCNERRIKDDDPCLDGFESVGSLRIRHRLNPPPPPSPPWPVRVPSDD